MCCDTDIGGNEWREMCRRERVSISKLFALPWRDANATLGPACSCGCGRPDTDASWGAMCVVRVLNERWFSVSILDSTNCSIWLIFIACYITPFLCSESFLVYDRTEYTDDIVLVRLGIHYPRAPVVGQLPTRTAFPWTPKYPRLHISVG